MDAQNLGRGAMMSRFAITIFFCLCAVRVFSSNNDFLNLCNPPSSLFKNRPIAFIAHDNAKKNLKK